MNCQKTHARVAIISQYQSWAGECRCQRGKRGQVRAGGVSHVYGTKQTAQYQRETVASCALKRKRVLRQRRLCSSGRYVFLSLSLFNIKGSIRYRGIGERKEEKERDREWESTDIISDAGARQLTWIELRSRDRLSLALCLPLSLSPCPTALR